MKTKLSFKKIIAVALLSTLPAFGQLVSGGYTYTPVDLTTPHVVTVTSSGYISISYSNVVMTGLTLQTNASGYVTNVVPIFITNIVNNAPYSAYRPGVTNWGDSPLTAFGKVNAMLTNYPTVYLPSNTWSLFYATNGMANFDSRLTSSNGIAISVKLSNGVALFQNVGP